MDCTLFIEDFKDISVAPGPFLLENFTCRKCGLIPADHNRKPEGVIRVHSFLLLFFLMETSP